jgi:hypothetical protein
MLFCRIVFVTTLALLLIDEVQVIPALLWKPSASCADWFSQITLTMVLERKIYLIGHGEHSITLTFFLRHSEQPSRLRCGLSPF